MLGERMAIPHGHWILRAGLLAGVAAVIAFAYWWHQRPVDRSASKAPPASATQVSVSWNKPSDNKNESSAPGKSAPVTASPASIRQRMKTAKDLFALAKEILPQAKAGNPEAQLALFEAYRRCFDNTGIQRKLYDNENAVRESAIKDGRSVDDAVSFFRQCHGFNTDAAASLGDPWDWLQQATDAGYPRAQKTTASERLLQDSLKLALRAGASPIDPSVSLPPIGGDSAPRELLAVAAQSADPEVLFAIGNLQKALNPTQPRDAIAVNTAAWIYVACQRGFDCSTQDATLANCGPSDRNCVTMPGWSLRQVNNNWAPVQEKINQINAALNAKQWDQLAGLIAGG
jgi:hypothetical protein